MRDGQDHEAGAAADGQGSEAALDPTVMEDLTRAAGRATAGLGVPPMSTPAARFHRMNLMFGKMHPVRHRPKLQPVNPGRLETVNKLSITYWVADQEFERTKSIGILNVSMQLLQHLADCENIDTLTLLANHTLNLDKPLPKRIKVQEYNNPIRGRLRRIAWDQWGVYRAAASAGNEWLFLPKGFASFLRSHPVKTAKDVQEKDKISIPNIAIAPYRFEPKDGR